MQTCYSHISIAGFAHHLRACMILLCTSWFITWCERCELFVGVLCVHVTVVVLAIAVYNEEIWCDDCACELQQGMLSLVHRGLNCRVIFLNFLDELTNHYTNIMVLIHARLLSPPTKQTWQQLKITCHSFSKRSVQRICSCGWALNRCNLGIRYYLWMLRISERFNLFGMDQNHSQCHQHLYRALRMAHRNVWSLFLLSTVFFGAIFLSFIFFFCSSEYFVIYSYRSVCVLYWLSGYLHVNRLYSCLFVGYLRLLLCCLSIFWCYAQILSIRNGTSSSISPKHHRMF